MHPFRRKSEQRTIADGGPVWSEGGWAPQFPPSPNDSLGVADVWACVRVLAGAAASLPLIPYRRQGEGRVRLDSGRLFDLLQRPSPATTQANLVGQAMSHLLLHGNCFVGKFRGDDGRLEQLSCLDPPQVEVELVAGSPRYKVTDPKTGRETYHGTDDILHVRALSTDGLVGLSPLKNCRLAVDYAKGMSESAAALTENGFLPAGIVTVPGGLSKQSIKKLSDGLAGKHGGARNMHRVAILSGNVNFTSMSLPADDLQFVQQRELSTREITRIFGVPVWMVNGSSGDSLTYSNAESQRLMFAIHSLRQWLVPIEQAITNDRDLCSQNVYVEFLIDALLRADSKTRAEIYALALDPVKGWMTRDEVRQRENLEAEGIPSAVSPVPQPNGSGVLVQ
jgi:HK97 family phage portal protein